MKIEKLKEILFIDGVQYPNNRTIMNKINEIIEKINKEKDQNEIQ